LAALRSGADVTRESAKVFVAHELLGLRHRHPDAFSGSYLALGSGPTTCAYQRGSDVVVAVSIRDQALDVELPDGDWTNLLDGLSAAYDSIPVAVFEQGSE
jgi:maltooligosyltrehalose synthase